MSDDKVLRSWDLNKRQIIKARLFQNSGRCVAFSPDARAIAVGFNNGSFVVVNSNNLGNIIGFHHRKEEISDIRFSPS